MEASPHGRTPLGRPSHSHFRAVDEQSTASSARIESHAADPCPLQGSSSGRWGDVLVFCEPERLTGLRPLDKMQPSRNLAGSSDFAPGDHFVSECRKPSPPLSEPPHHQQLRFERSKKSLHADETGCIGSDNHSCSDQPVALSRNDQSYQLQRFDQ